MFQSSLPSCCQRLMATFLACQPDSAQCLLKWSLSSTAVVSCGWAVLCKNSSLKSSCFQQSSVSDQIGPWLLRSNKFVGTFFSTGTIAGGQESTSISCLPFFAHMVSSLDKTWFKRNLGNQEMCVISSGNALRATRRQVQAVGRVERSRWLTLGSWNDRRPRWKPPTLSTRVGRR